MIQLLAVLSGAFLWAAEPSLTIVTPKKTVSLSLSEMKKIFKVQTVEIDDPVYKAKKSFEAFALADVFKAAGFEGTDAADEIVFTAKDGYSPNMSFADMKKHTGYLAF